MRSDEIKVPAMTEQAQPEWLKGYTPQKAEPWTKGMPSPNPRGRPKGTLIDKRTRVTRTMMEDAPSIARVVIDAALAGDMQAASLVLSRVAPALKAQAERVEFDLDPAVPLSEQARQILQAVAEGKVDAETARILIGCISSVANVAAVEELAARLEALEARDR